MPFPTSKTLAERIEESKAKLAATRERITKAKQKEKKLEAKLERFENQAKKASSAAA
jgi:septal ring factor EnvC (AmiA/AmiB activator)